MISGTFFAVTIALKPTLKPLWMPAIPQTHMNPGRERMDLEDSYRDAYAKFAELASHDLRAPLRKLGVLTDKLVSRIPNDKEEETRQYRERINACILEMQALVDGFAEFASVASVNMTPGPCDLGELADKTLKEFTAVAREKQADIVMHNLPQIEGDCKQLRLLFKKIVENAFKFSRQGEPFRLSITGEEMNTMDLNTIGIDSFKKYYKIKISDNGVGFNGAGSENIFEPLVRLHGKSAYPGSGLGLAIVKRIVENHSGLVSAEEGEKGATITILLPENLN